MKVLLSTLGRGQYDREKGMYDYKESIYLLPDGREVETKLVSKALIDYIEPEEVYILGTEESLWDLADELIRNYKKVIIPFGKTQEEFWEMFSIINKEIDVSGKYIYLDITHGFRAIPLLVSTVVNLFSKVKGASVKGLFYGIFEAKDDKGRTPVVDLLPVLELNEWIEAFTLFKNYGDGDLLAWLIENKLSEFEPVQRKEMGKLNSLPKLLRKYSRAVGFTALDYIPLSAGQVVGIINELKSLPISLQAVDLLRASINDMYQEIKEKHPEKWKNHLQLVKWLFDKRRYSQATIALEECIFTYVLESIGIDPLDNLRKNLGSIFREDEKRNKFFTAELNSLFSKIRDLRNRTGHAFMNMDSSEGHIKDAIEDLESYIKETEKVLTEGGINDKEALKESIGDQKQL